ncbi:hypothetical protein RIF29_17084 [Crotalaria pallida]|uniref:Uncharacterized protein n=1 Tax=Crotalaria pallida TaxID=3830 RepID=A0AAN9FGF0_CROPI
MTSKSHRLTTCHRHPTVPITGFCASCLSERLSESSTSHHHLRRTKSCSGGHLSLPAAASPRRWSCDVRPRSTLSDLFHVDDHNKKDKKRSGTEIQEVQVNGIEEAVRVCDEAEGEKEETKTMKEFMDLEFKNRKNERKDLRSFWHAASVFSNKLRKWTWKHKLKKKKKMKHCRFDGNEDVEKSRARRRLRETQSEVGEYELGRRSCDAGRISVDYDSRISFDAPRASWDGYLIGNKACHRLSPMISVVEDENHKVLIQESSGNNIVDSFSPGGSIQTKDYYYSCRKSFDRSNSHRRKSIGAEADELKLMSSATSELFYGAKLLITEKELMDGNVNVNVKSTSDVVQSDCVSGSASKDDSDVATEASQNGQNGFKKFQKWRKVWNKLGLVQKKEGECDTGDTVSKPLAESWQKLRRVVNVPSSESVSQKLIRSYSVSCRNPCRMAGLISSLGANEAQGNVWNGRQEFALQRNRSARYSPNNLDAGLLRFYLTPLKSYRRSKSGRSSLKDLHPVARNVL